MLDNPHQVMAWFDVHSTEHLEAYRHLSIHGCWPEGFITKDRPLPHLWTVILAQKMADAWVALHLGSEDARDR